MSPLRDAQSRRPVKGQRRLDQHHQRASMRAVNGRADRRALQLLSRGWLQLFPDFAGGMSRHETCTVNGDQRRGCRGGDRGTMHLGAFTPAGDGDARRRKDLSEATAEMIDLEVQRIIDESYEPARTLLAEHRAQLDDLASALTQETLNEASVLAITGIEPAKATYQSRASTAKATDRAEVGRAGREAAAGFGSRRFRGRPIPSPSTSRGGTLHSPDRGSGSRERGRDVAAPW